MITATAAVPSAVNFPLPEYSLGDHVRIDSEWLTGSGIICGFSVLVLDNEIEFGYTVKLYKLTNKQGFPISHPPIECFDSEEVHHA